jgi:hypothetical protein
MSGARGLVHNHQHNQHADGQADVPLGGRRAAYNAQLGSDGNR